jgi:hypothetical protein
MIRKTLLTSAAAALALSLGAAVAFAGAPSYLGAPGLDNLKFKQDAKHYDLVCEWKRVKTYYGWKKKKVCRKVYYEHNSY